MAQHPGPVGTARVAISGSIFGEPWTNVVWANVINGQFADQGQFDSYVSIVYGHYLTAFKPSINDQVQISEATGVIFQPGETALHSTHSEPTVGGKFDPLIENAAACRVISWLSNVYWKGGKPRMYLPGVSDIDTADGKTVTPAEQTVLRQAGSDFHSLMNAITIPPDITVDHGFVSFFSGTQPGQPPQYRPTPLFFPITGAAAHRRLGTQRRRLGAWVP